MILSGKKMQDLIEIQRELELKSEFFKQNRFILFTMSISSNKASVIQALIKELHIDEEEVFMYIDTLTEYELISIADKKLLNSLNDKFKSKEFDHQFSQIISHFNRVTNKNRTLTNSVKKDLNAILVKGFTVVDFKTIVRHLFDEWGSNPTMKIHITPSVFFKPEKFEERLETAREFFENINKHSKETNKFCRKFTPRILIEFRKDTQMNTVCEATKFTCDEMPISLKKAIVFWIEKGFSIDDIIITTEMSIESFSQNPKLINHISLLKILDYKFEERFKVVLNKKNKEKQINKSSVAAVGGWMDGK